MAVPFIRYQYEFSTSLSYLTDRKYTILIRDATLGSDLNLDFCTDERGFEINFPTEDDEFQDALKPSSCVIGFLVQNSTDQTFVESLIKDQEGDYFIEVLRDGSPIWRGVIAQDESREENRAFPFTFEITAIDGISELRNSSGLMIIPGPSIGNLLEPSRYHTVLQMMIYVLGQTRTALLFDDTTDTFLITGGKWYETSMVADVDPLANMAYVADNIEFKYDNQGVIQYETHYDILKNVLEKLNLRIFVNNGSFLVWQTNELRFNEIDVFAYAKGYRLTDPSPLTNVVGILAENVPIDLKLSVDNSIPIEKGLNLNHEVGDIFSYLGGFNEVTVGYDYQLNNIWKGNKQEFNLPGYYSTGQVVYNDTGYYIDIQGNTEIFFDGIVPDLNPPFATFENLFITLDLYIKVGIYYYDPSVHDWVTTPTPALSHTNAGHTFSSYSGTNNHPTMILPINYRPKAPPVEDVLELRTAVSISTSTIGSTIDIDYTESTVDINYEDLDGNPITVGYTATNQNIVTSSLSLDLGKTSLGDRPDQILYNKWYIYNGSVFTSSVLWHVGQVGTQRRINELLVEEIIKVRTRPSAKWDVNILGDYTPFKTLDWNSREFIFNGGTFTGATESWRMTALELSVPFAGGIGIGDAPAAANLTGVYKTTVTSDNAITGSYGSNAFDQTQLATTGAVLEGTASTLAVTSTIDFTIVAGDQLTITNDLGKIATLDVTVDHVNGELLTFTEQTFTYAYAVGSILSIDTAQVKNEVVNGTTYVRRAGDTMTGPLVFERANGTTAGAITASDANTFGFGVVGKDEDDNLTNVVLGGNNIYLGTGSQYIANNNAVSHGYLKLGGSTVTDPDGNEFYPLAFQQIEQELYSETFSTNTDIDLSNGFDTVIIGPNVLVNNYADPSDFEFTFELQETSVQSTEVDYWITVNGSPSTVQTTVVQGGTTTTVNGSTSILNSLSTGDSIILFVRANDTGGGRNTHVRGDLSPSTYKFRQLGFGNAFNAAFSMSGGASAIKSVYSEAVLLLTAATVYTLPLLSTLSNKTIMYNLKNISGGIITVITSGGDTIDGMSSITIQDYENKKLFLTSTEFLLI